DLVDEVGNQPVQVLRGGAQLRHADSLLALVGRMIDPRWTTGPFAVSVTNAPGSRTSRRFPVPGAGRPRGPAGDLAGSSTACHEQPPGNEAASGWRPARVPVQPRTGGGESARHLERSVPWERGWADRRPWYPPRSGWSAALRRASPRPPATPRSTHRS